MGAFDTYLKALQQLHVAAGAPSAREIASLSQQPISHSTVNDILKGWRVGGWHTTARIVCTLAYVARDTTAVDRIRELWDEVQLEKQAQQKEAAPTTEADLLAQILRELQEQRAMLERLIAAANLAR